MAPYLIFPNLQSAQTSSRNSWVTTLGHAKKPEDVSEFLWPWLIGLDGRVALDVANNPGRVIAPSTVATLDPANWPPPT